MSQRRIDAINKFGRRTMLLSDEKSAHETSHAEGSSQTHGEEESSIFLPTDHRVAKGLTTWRRTKRALSKRLRNTDSDELELPDNENELNEDINLGTLITEVTIQARNEGQHEHSQHNDANGHRHAADNATADIEWSRTCDNAFHDDKTKKEAALAYPTHFLLDVLNDLRDRLLKMPQTTALAPMIWQAMHDQIDTLSTKLPPYTLANVRRQLIDHTTPSPPDAPPAVRTYHLLLPLVLLQATCPRPKSQRQRAHALLNTMQIATEINSSEIRKCAPSFAS